MKAKKIGFFLMMSFSAAFVLAGTFVTGYGDTRTEAVRDAERKAEQLARQKGTCYDFVEPKQCVKDSEGGWSCRTGVANHQGSCGSGKVKPQK